MSHIAVAIDFQHLFHSHALLDWSTKKTRLFCMLSHSWSRTFVLCLAQVVLCSPFIDERVVADEPLTVRRVVFVDLDAPDGPAAEIGTEVGGVRINLVKVLGISEETTTIQVDHPAKFTISDSSLDSIVYGPHRDATDLRLQMGRILSSKTEAIDRTWELTDLQRQKLKLAANGDAKRFLDLFADLKQDFRTQVVDANNHDDILKLATELARKAGPLRNRLYCGPFDKNSLYAKTLTNIRNARSAADHPE